MGLRHWIVALWLLMIQYRCLPLPIESGTMFRISAYRCFGS